MQAVALRISGAKAMFYKVKVAGTRDTLLDETGSHYFHQPHIRGSVDFIFAHRRDDTGFSFVNCKINGTGRIYLGRAWGNYSRAIYSNCYFENINPAGWTDWNGKQQCL
ncbi:Pectinesterase QRT1 [Hibiscus syriacus]|uniref:pectinesterase n=1 Tax=Hibiscus syriacus TaxID=106335 RepID=A0A6A3ALM6_HIBSY|nr:Pectinesterase QRT1 [Hibiscus syriacus]